ncbi:hypothetical protein ACHAXS_011188, partial [Conticribra weissflogii]
EAPLADLGAVEDHQLARPRGLPDDDEAPCWRANRSSQVQLADSLEGAWKVLEEEEDDGEAVEALEGGVTVSMRVGYRSAVCVAENEEVEVDGCDDDCAEGEGTNHLDYREREGKFPGDARVSLLFAGSDDKNNNDADDDHDHDDDKDERGDRDSKHSKSRPPVALVHNLSKEYVLHSLKTSPMVRRYKLNNNNGSHTSDGSAKRVRLISLAHNPETQIAAYLISNANRQSASDKGNSKDAALLHWEAREYMKKSLTSAFVGFEQAVRNGYIDGYGVCSNGLSLPEGHDMAMSWRDVLECAVDAFVEVNGGDKPSEETQQHQKEQHQKEQQQQQQYQRSSLKVIRLPGNVLETRGLEVSKEICSFFGTCRGDDDKANEPSSPPSEEGLHSITDDPNDHRAKQRRKLRKSRNILPQSIQVHVTRPLTAYPFGGTGIESDSSPGLSDHSGLSAPPLYLKKNPSQVDGESSNKDGGGSSIDATHPIRLLDYRIESGPIGREPTMAWTNHHYASHGLRPSSYQPVLNAVLSHFDAESILEASRTRELTVEERETLDGCKLLRDMIHDLDASLDDMRSFAAYEEYLMNVAVPLIYGSFEGLDEESAAMLQLFFRAHGMAVRMVVARWTRELLLGGWKRRRVVVDEKGRDGNGDQAKDRGVAGEDSVKKDKDQEKKIAKIWKEYGFGDFRGGYDIPGDVTLQDFALRQILEEEAVRGVVVGCSSPEHALEAMRAADASGVSDVAKSTKE